MSTRSALAAAVFALATVSVPAVASATTPPEPPVESSTPGDARLARLATACGRVPPLQRRVDAAIALLQGDASTRGSIAWLDARLTAAQGDDRVQLATVLQNRIDVRTARLALLQERSTALAGIASICATHGLGA
jgi:hypothetical protein